MGSVNNNGPKVEYKPDPPKPEQKDNSTSSTPAGSTPAASTPAPSTPAGSSPVGSTQAVGSTAGSTPVSKPNGNGTTPPIISGPKSDTFTPSNNLFVGSLDTEIPGAKALAAGSTPAGSTPAGSAPAGSSPAGSSPAGSTPAGSSPAGSSPAGSTTAGSTPAGSSPTGTTTVLVIDNGQNPITNYGETHMALVSGTVKKYAPDVKIATFDLGGQISTGEDGLPAVKATGPEGVDKWIDSYAQIPEGQIDILKAGLEENPDAKVINTSFGASRRQVYDDIYTSIINPDNADADKLGLKLGLSQADIDGLQKEYLEYKGSGADPDGTRFKSLSDTKYSKTVQDGISAYVDAKMDDPNGTFQKGLKKYQDYTKELSEKGVTVVTSYGNDGGGASWTYNQYKTGSEDQTVNFNAMSDYVISVAASTTNGPDGKPTQFSSYGGGKWKPTISADGEDVAGIDGTVDGTSFSAPTVAGTIGEMLVKNPNLKFTDIKKNLQTNAFDTPADEYKEGAGILNYEKSIANAGSTPAGSTPAGSTPAGSSPAGSSPAGSSPAGSTPAGSSPAGSSPAGSSPAGSTPAGSTPVGSTPTASTYTLDQAFFDFGRDPNAAKDNNGKYLTTDFKGGYFGTTQGQADLGRIDALDGNADGKIDKTYVTGLSDANSDIYKSYVKYDPTKASADANKGILTSSGLFDKLDGYIGDDTIVTGKDIDKALKSNDFTAEEKIRISYLKNAKQSGGGTLWDAIAGGNTYSSNEGGVFDTKKLTDLAKLDWDPAKVSKDSATTPTDINGFYKSLATHKDAKGNINYQELLTDTTDPTLAGLRNFKFGNKTGMEMLQELDKAEHKGTARGFVDVTSVDFIQKYGEGGYNVLVGGTENNTKDNTKMFLPLIPTTFTTFPENHDGIYRPDDVKAAINKQLEDPTLSLAERRALEYLTDGGTGKSILTQWDEYVKAPGQNRKGTAEEWQAFLATLAPTG